MRKLKFILSALAILLAGALAVGFAAQAVVAPRAGETVSAGVVSVPPVLGQSTEEVLFYPWSLYDTLALEPCFPFLDSEEEVQAVKENAASFPYRFFAPFSLFGVQFDEDAALRATEYAFVSRTQSNLTFLKDVPAQDESGTPLVVSFAHSDWDPFAISYLIRPQNPGSITEEQRQQALERVKADLHGLLTAPEMLDAVIGEELDRDMVYAMFQNGELPYIDPSGELRPIDNGMASLLAGYYVLSWHRSLDSRPLSHIWQLLKDNSDFYGCTAETPLDDVLAKLDSRGVQIQLVPTQGQVIALFTCGTTMVGVYYDIQLERYSGLGLRE